MKRILIYSHDTFGLGNIRRMLEIARHLVAASADVTVLVITGSPMLHAFRIPARIDYLKLPCLARNVEGRYAARSLELTLDATVRLRANIIRSAIADFQPDLILVDKKPFGVEDELAAAFETLPGGGAATHATSSRSIARRASGGPRPKLVLLLRDILDSPEATTRVWRKNGYFEAIDAYYDSVLVVGAPEVFDLRREYRFPPLAAAKVRYCGYIAREPGREPRSAVRQTLAVNEHEPLLLITAGGGEDGYAIIRAAVDALMSIDAAACPRTHIVCGPQMCEAQRHTIARLVHGMARVSVQDFSDDMMSLMNAADVVLAMGGYNTVCELLTLRKRALVVPRVKPGHEQLIRATRMANLGLLRMLAPQDVTSTALITALQHELCAHARGEIRPALRATDGLGQVSSTLLELLGLGSPRLVRLRAAPAQGLRALLPAPAGHA